MQARLSWAEGASTPMREMVKGMMAGLGHSFSGQDFLLAVIVSSGAIIVLLYGAFGITGNQVVTAAILLVPTVALFFCGHLAGFRPNLIDGLFVGFVICVCVTTLINGISAIKELQLLFLSLLHYPAARFLAVREPQWTFVATTGAIVTAGAVATGIALVQQTGFMIGKPVVFGFGHAATVFSISLCFFAISLLSNSMNSGHILGACIALFVPAAIFAASQVRFVFAVLAVTFAVMAIVTQRKSGFLIMATLGVAILTGLAANYRVTALHVERDILGRSQIVDDAEVAKDPGSAAQAACLGPGSYNNSVAIRRALLNDAITQIPLSGFFGSGLASFRSACLGRESPHNSLLQATIEFGWIGGLVFFALMVLALLRVWPLAFKNPGARFALYSVIFATLFSMVYGRLEAEALLYLFLGLSGAAVNERE